MGRLGKRSIKERLFYFFCAVDDPMFSGAIDNINHTDHGIRCRVDWSKTARGGRQYDLIDTSLDTKCSSAYGLCG